MHINIEYIHHCIITLHRVKCDPICDSSHCFVFFIYIVYMILTTDKVWSSDVHKFTYFIERHKHTYYFIKKIAYLNVRDWHVLYGNTWLFICNTHLAQSSIYLIVGIVYLPSPSTITLTTTTNPTPTIPLLLSQPPPILPTPSRYYSHNHHQSYPHHPTITLTTTTTTNPTSAIPPTLPPLLPPPYHRHYPHPNIAIIPTLPPPLTPPYHRH